MDFLFKVAFFVLFGLTCLIFLYLVMMTSSVALDPYGKRSEVVIMLIGATMLSVGLYFAYQQVKDSDKYLLGGGILVATWLGTLVTVLIGLFCFNGPIRWN
jgi:hypothetical protein